MGVGMLLPVTVRAMRVTSAGLSALVSTATRAPPVSLFADGAPFWVQALPKTVATDSIATKVIRCLCLK